MQYFLENDESPIVTDESLLNIDDLTPEDACIWLLEKLNYGLHINNPYCIPFMNYVLTWSKVVPITAIIMGQSPYPNNIFPEIAAAMSFDTDLCMQSRIGRPAPPTVEVFANDMFINGGMAKEDLTAVIQNGWCLIEKGVLLVNEAVFEKSGSPDADVESTSQQWVIRRLLMETEKHGERTVDVYGLGEAGHRMMNDLSSSFKSSIIRLSKHKAPHPAGVARRFNNNLSAPLCNLNTPAFSKSLGKHLSNYVAFAYTMAAQRAKKAEIEISIQRNADLIKLAVDALTPLPDRVTETMTNLKKFNQLLKDGKFDELTFAGDKLYDSFERLYTRTNLINGAFKAAGVQTTGGVANTSKPGPSRTAIQPSATGLSAHTGGSVTTAPTNNIKRIPINSSASRRSSVSTTASAMEPMSPTSEAAPMRTVIKKKIIKPAIKQRAVSDSVVDTTPVVSGPAFTKQPLTVQPKVVNSKKSKLTGIEELQETNSPVSKALNKEQIIALSTIAALVDTHSADATDPDVVQDLDNIQNDIDAKTIYNGCVERLVEAINKDIAMYKEKGQSFNLSTWIVKPNFGKSYTYEECSEMFNFN